MNMESVYEQVSNTLLDMPLRQFNQSLMLSAQAGKIISLKFLLNSSLNKYTQNYDCSNLANKKVLDEARRQLEEYFQGHRSCFELPIFLQGTAFQKLTWETLKSIPYGKTATYTDIAQQVSKYSSSVQYNSKKQNRSSCKAFSPNAYRAVGYANSINPLPIILPCHRVTAKSNLGGYQAGIEVKKYLLALEAKIATSLTLVPSASF